MTAAGYLGGVALVGVVLGGFWMSGRSLRLRLLGGWQGAPAVLAGIVLALAVAILSCEALGLLGLLDSPALVAVSVLTALALYRWLPAGSDAGAPPARESGRVALALAVAAALLTAVHWAGPTLSSLDVGIYRQDSLWYHLPFAAWFAQTGSVGGLLLTDPLKLTVWYYPLNSELLHSIGMVLLGNDLLSPVLNFGWMGVALLAGWCIGRPFGLAAATLLGTVVVLDSDMMLVQAGNAPGDVAALACLLAAVAILANGWAARGGSIPAVVGERGISIGTGPLAVAALAAGLAIGTKVTMLAPVGVITIAILLGGRDERARRAVVWLGGLLATGGFWYLRNLVHAGNPLPWIQAGPLPGPEQIDLYPRPAHSMAEYLADRHAWTEFFLPGLGETLGPLWFVVVFASFAGIALGLRRRHSPLVRALALTAAVTLVAHVFNPISASGPDGGPYGFASNLRYASPGLALGLILLPLCETGGMVRRVIVPAYALLIAVAAIGSDEWNQPKLAAALAIAAAAVLVPVWLARGGLTRRRLPAVAALVAVVLLAGYAQQREYFKDRYRTDVAPRLDNPGFRATGQWRLIQTWARAQRGLRIGIVGTPAAFGQYVLYGEDLSNEVRYLGEHTPHGGLSPILSCRRWRAQVRAGRYDAILITPEDPDIPVLPPQIAWTGQDPAARPILQVLPAAVFGLAGPLDPSRCGYAGGGNNLTPVPRQPSGRQLPPGWRPGR